jgi:hypothetical protein
MNYIDQFKNIYHITKKTILQYKELSFAENSALWKIKIKPLDNIIKNHKKILCGYYFLACIVTIFVLALYRVLPPFDDLNWETFLDVLKEDVSWMIFPNIPIVLYWISAQIFLTYSCASLRYSLCDKDYNSISGGYRFIGVIINVLPVLLSCLTIVICCLIQIFIKLKNLTIQNYAIAVVWTLTIMSMLGTVTK